VLRDPRGELRPAGFENTAHAHIARRQNAARTSTMNCTKSVTITAQRPPASVQATMIAPVTMMAGTSGTPSMASANLHMA